MGMIGKAIARKASPPGEPPPAADDMDGDEDAAKADEQGAKESAASELQSALKSGTASEVADAFSKLMDICQDY